MERACCFSIIIDKTRQIFGKAWGDSIWMLASYADILWARHAIFLPPRGGGRLRDEPKECLCRRLSGCWICLKHRNEMNLDDKRCLCPSSGGHSRKLAKIPIPNRLYQVFDQVGKSFSDYKPETNWCTKCKVEADKKFKEQRKYIPRKRKTCNKQKVEQFSTLISVSSRCAS